MMRRFIENISFYDLSKWILISYLLIGWCFFVLWVAARYLDAYDFQFADGILLFWTIGILFIPIGALLLLLIHVILTRELLKRTYLIIFGHCLLSVYSVYFISKYKTKIEKRVFVRIENQGSTIYDSDLIGKLQNHSFGEIAEGTSKVVSYEPAHFYADDRLYTKSDTLQLILLLADKIEKKKFPQLKAGECATLKLKFN